MADIDHRPRGLRRRFISEIDSIGHRGISAGDSIAPPGQRSSTRDSGLASHLFASECMSSVLATAHRVARSNISVLLVGEAGTEHEAMARFIHNESLQREATFRVVRCSDKAALLRVLDVEAVRLRGTLFFDELGHLESGAARAIGELARVHRGSERRQFRIIAGTTPARLATDARSTASLQRPGLARGGMACYARLWSGTRPPRDS
jgi:hypothetical protein